MIECRWVRHVLVSLQEEPLLHILCSHQQHACFCQGCWRECLFQLLWHMESTFLLAVRVQAVVFCVSNLTWLHRGLPSGRMGWCLLLWVKRRHREERSWEDSVLLPEVILLALGIFSTDQIFHSFFFYLSIQVSLFASQWINPWGSPKQFSASSRKFPLT
jgi:hypothetical protein